jgi:hypothetical protein
MTGSALGLLVTFCHLILSVWPYSFRLCSCLQTEKALALRVITDGRSFADLLVGGTFEAHGRVYQIRNSDVIHTL